MIDANGRFAGHAFDPMKDGVPWEQWQTTQINLEWARHGRRHGNILPATISHGFKQFCEKLELKRSISILK